MEYERIRAARINQGKRQLTYRLSTVNKKALENLYLIIEKTIYKKNTTSYN